MTTDIATNAESSETKVTAEVTSPETGSNLPANKNDYDNEINDQQSPAGIEKSDDNESDNDIDEEDDKIVPLKRSNSCDSLHSCPDEEKKVNGHNDNDIHVSPFTKRSLSLSQAANTDPPGLSTLNRMAQIKLSTNDVTSDSETPNHTLTSSSTSNENDTSTEAPIALSATVEPPPNDNTKQILADDGDKVTPPLPSSSQDETDNNIDKSNVLSEVLDEDTWVQITKRDRPISNANAIAVMDHSFETLKKRISEATTEHNFQQNLKIFEKSLARFQNSEIILGKRIASGNFADIYLIREFQPMQLSVKACTEEQKEAAENIKRNYKSNELVIKVLRGNLLLNPSLYATAAADFITEGTILASLDHPHIVSLRGRSVPNVDGFASGKRDSVFLVLERLHGDLTHKVRQWKERNSENRIIYKGVAGRRDGRATVLRERVQAMAELADALAYLHERRIVHRDLKLQNVGIDSRGRMKLLDFGLAKVLPKSTDENETFQLTGNTGSIRYMAPEVARGEYYNLKVDVYSFAILFYEVLNLEKAFSGWQPHEISDKVHAKKYRPRLSLFWPATLRDLFKATWSDLPAGRLSMSHVHMVLRKEAEELRSSMNASVQ